LQLKWLDDFKAAIIEKDFDRIELLLSQMPDFKSINDLKTGVALINEAKKLLIAEQKVLRENMEKIKKSREFLKNEPQHSFSESC